MPKYWTLTEAKAALPEAVALIEQLRDLIRRGRSGAAGRERRHGLGGPRGARSGNGRGPSSNGHGSSEPAGQLDVQARQLMERIQAMGFQVKDVEAGLIDFPCMRNGEEALLCYRLGEPDIQFWHDLESGFAGRRPVEEL
ncbi:MAG TPA: DUF2203 domain-containing protein [Dehalococcoidia bacterium]|jgi:hypothetical protein